jgi:diacylglycerol kinase family enzyme
VVHRYISNGSPDESVRVYAVGGDGILFDCLNGMVDFQNAEITNVPYGNSNDFVRTFGEDAKQKFRNINKLIKAPSRPIDIIKCGPNYAITQIGIGLEGQATIDGQAIFQRLKSYRISPFVGLIYTLCSFGTIFNKEVMKQTYQALLDGEDLSGSYFNIKISNSACNGGNMVSNPYAKPDDGLLDVLFAAAGSFPSVLKAMGCYGNGKFEKCKNISYRQCKKIEIKSNVPIRVQMDGEAYYTEEFVAEILKSRVRFFAPGELEYMDYSFMAYKNTGKQKRGAK